MKIELGLIMIAIAGGMTSIYASEQYTEWDEKCMRLGVADALNGLTWNEETSKYCGQQPGGMASYSQGFIGGCVTDGNTEEECWGYTVGD